MVSKGERKLAAWSLEERELAAWSLEERELLHGQ